MAMAMAPTFSPNPIPFSTSTSTTTTTKHTSPSLSYHSKSTSNDKTRDQSLQLRRVASIPYQPINVDYLEAEFSGHGVTFRELGDSCVAKLALENGSAVVLMLPAGLITSYKPAMWYGGTDEMLHSLASEAPDGDLVTGGLSSALSFRAGDGVSCSPSNWVLHSIRGNSKDSIQVELISTDSMDKVEIKKVISLREDELSSELMISNSSSSAVQLTGCGFLSHLRVSSPEATFAIGLEGSDFFIRPPFRSKLAVIPPEFGTEKGSRFSQMMKQISFSGQRNQNDGSETKSKSEPEEDLEGEEDENYKSLGPEMSLIYTSAPRNLTVIDRGRRNSVIVGSKGFDELYMFSPGSGHEFYGKYSYVCVGQSAMLKPITLGPDQVLHLGLDLFNPNL